MKHSATSILVLVAAGSWLVATGWFGRAADPAVAAPTQETTNHPVMIHRAPRPLGVNTGLTNAQGQAMTVGCAACHATTRPNALTRRAADLKQFHQGLNYAHGELTCLSCHNPGNYESFRLADGQPVAAAEVMTLCGQCHGLKLRDYQHGLHGGMTGHWDLARGPRTRNHCLNCHDPHSPKYPLALPVFPPRDRISVKPNKALERH